MLYPVKINGKYGYISSRGELVVQASFVFCASFIEGVGLTVSEMGYSFVDGAGTELGGIETEWCDSAHEGLAAFSREAVGTGKQGYVDIFGEVAIEPVFDDAGRFTEGLASVSIAHSAGVIDKRGNWVIGVSRFDKIGTYGAGLAPARLNGRWGYIDRHGKSMLKFAYERTWTPSEDRLLVSEGGKLGYLYMDGCMCIAFEFETAEPFSEGLAACAIVKGQAGFVDCSGEWVIPPRFTAAKGFSEGLAAVYVGGTVNGDGDPVGGKWGYCGRTGEMVIEAQFERADSFAGGLAKVLSGAILSKEETIGYINSNGDWIWNPTR